MLNQSLISIKLTKDSKVFQKVKINWEKIKKKWEKDFTKQQNKDKLLSNTWWDKVHHPNSNPLTFYKIIGLLGQTQGKKTS